MKFLKLTSIQDYVTRVNFDLVCEYGPAGSPLGGSFIYLSTGQPLDREESNIIQVRQTPDEIDAMLKGKAGQILFETKD